MVRSVSPTKYACKMRGRGMGWVKRNFGEKSPIIFPNNSWLYKIYAFSELNYTSKQYSVPGFYRSIFQLFVNDTLHNNFNPYPTILSSVLYSLNYSPILSIIFKTGIFTSKRDFSQSRNAYPFILNYNVHYLFSDVDPVFWNSRSYILFVSNVKMIEYHTF